MIPSEIIHNMLIYCYFLFISILKAVKLLNIFVKMQKFIFSTILWLIKKFKNQHLFEIETFCNIINAFTVTFN